jgi:hypothetical protein
LKVMMFVFVNCPKPPKIAGSMLEGFINQLLLRTNLRSEKKSKLWRDHLFWKRGTQRCYRQGIIPMSMSIKKNHKIKLSRFC